MSAETLLIVLCLRFQRSLGYRAVKILMASLFIVKIKLICDEI